MDDKPIKTLRLYTDCDDLMMYNWEKISKTNDLRWLIVGFDGYGQKSTEEEKEQLEIKYKEIVSEINDLTNSNEADNYFDLVCDLSDIQTRIEIASFALYQIDSRPLMNEETFDIYIGVLKDWRFYWNKSKPKAEELKRLDRQLGAVKMKASQHKKEKEKIENKSTEKIALRKIKQRVSNKIGRDIDFRKTSVSEWIYILEDVSKQKRK